MTRRPRVLKTPEEIEQNFREVFGHLTSSSRDYDAGQKSEAARLAAAIYVLVYDGGRAKPSLLTLVARKNILFKNTSVPINGVNVLPQTALVMIRSEIAVGSRSVEYTPVFGRGDPRLHAMGEQPFDQWWNTKIFIEGATEAAMIRGHRRVLTRGDVVLEFRHKEGGGHVDRTVDEVIADLRRSHLAGFSLRQIAYEVEQTLIAHCRDILEGKPAP